MIPSSKNLDELLPATELREVGSQATWTLSSCKPGFGVMQLRDHNNDTYWQSDGPQPHLVNIHFRRKMPLSLIAIFSDYKVDESYTPSKLSVRVGSHFNDLEEVRTVELLEPSGWVVIEIVKESILLQQENVPGTSREPMRAFMVQLAVLQNHQNGRDTHIRQIKVFAPTDSLSSSVSNLWTNFSSLEMQQHCTLR